MAKVLEGKEIDPNSMDSVKGLTHELDKMVSLARAMKEESFLQLDATIVSIIKKRVPMRMKGKFGKAAKRARKAGTIVDVDFLVAFLSEWYEDLNHEYGISNLIDSKTVSNASSVGPSSPPVSTSSKVTKSSKADIAAADAAGGQQKLVQPQQHPSTCFYCRDAHAIENCSAFIQISAEECIGVIFKQSRCLKCCQVGHIAARCEAASCHFCGKGHHSLLHAESLQVSRQVPSTSAVGANFVVNQRNFAASSNIGQGQVNISAIAAMKNKGDVNLRPIVAVKVLFGDGRTADVYALLDSGSNKTVVTQAFKRRFRLATHQEQATINTFGASSVGLRDAGVISLQSLVKPDFNVKNLNVLVVESLPVDSSHIPRQGDVDRYDHLEGVKLIDLPTDEVDMVIGTNLPQVFLHQFAMKPAQDGPVCLYSPLGWCYMG